MTAPYTLNTGSTAGATSFTITGSVSMTAGDVLVINANTSKAITAITDSQGNSYVPVNVNGTVSQWVTAGKTKALNGAATITITLAASGTGNAVAIGVPGAVFAPVDANASATGTGTAASVTTASLITSDGQTAVATILPVSGTITWTGGFTGLGTSGTLGTAYAQNETGTVTASGTVTSGAWTALVVTLQMTSFVGAEPSAPTQRAGQLATSSDMNAMAQAALFLRRPPMAVVQSASSGTGQGMTVAASAVTYTQVLRDTDGMFNPGSPSHLTVQTPGFYKVRYSIPFAVAGTPCQVWVRVQTGANNPAGAGVQSPWWYSFCGAGNTIDGCVCGGGVIPVYFYQADFIQVMASVGVASNMPTTPQPAIVSMRMVSQ